ncbi:DUF2182 domain-containing protein [Labrenzia sp. OB1]|uniref:DUF2182 domain-containing protein n=1 Tax=Labrenzia sp. OB1 TaxID=1561204 RepID=UPI0009EDF70B|nr:DUF2182 domain-containing protein [Labrenzia sp. OB1]
MTPIDLGVWRMLRNAPMAGAGLIGMTLACWLYFLAGAGTGMDVWKMSLPGIPPTAGQSAMMGSPLSIGVVSMAFMWWTMMLAMMMPGAFRHLPAHRQAGLSPAANLLGFWVSYAGVWLGFSVIATGLQYVLVDAGLLHGMKMWSANSWFSATLLAIAGLYQFTAIKARSLASCHAVPSDASPVRNGAAYGLHCLTSSFPLMLLLFMGGVMNFYWVALLTAVVTLEKILPNPKPFSMAVGVACICATVAVLTT